MQGIRNAARAIMTLAALLAGPARAQDQALRFDVLFAGLRVGEIALQIAQQDQRYRAQTTIRSAGLAGMVRPISFVATVEGWIDDGGPRPDWYVESADTGRRLSEAELRWADRRPKVIRYEETAAPAPADGPTGSVDPLTALLAALQDRPATQGCAATMRLFDGRRESLLMLHPTAPLRCEGLYRRVAGFTADELAEKTDFPLGLTYALGPEGNWQMIGADVQTLYGKVRLKRR